MFLKVLSDGSIILACIFLRWWYVICYCFSEHCRYFYGWVAWALFVFDEGEAEVKVTLLPCWAVSRYGSFGGYCLLKGRLRSWVDPRLPRCYRSIFQKWKKVNLPNRRDVRRDRLRAKSFVGLPPASFAHAPCPLHDRALELDLTWLKI